MANYRVKFNVHYVGGTTDSFEDVITEQMYHSYSDGSQGSSRMADLAMQHDNKGRKINYVTMQLIEIRR
jgi:hypothetical protein